MTILIVDGLKVMRDKLGLYLDLEKNFQNVFEASTVVDAKKIMKEIQIDVLLMDIQLPDKSGLKLIEFCRELPYKPQIIVFTNYGMRQYQNIYKDLSVDYSFDKSSELYSLKKTIKKIVKENKDEFNFSNRY